MQRDNVETTNTNEAAHRRKLANAINRLNDTLVIRGSITPVAGSAVISDERIGTDAIALFFPADSDSAGSDYYAVVAATEVTLTIVSGTDGAFNYIIIL